MTRLIKLVLIKALEFTLLALWLLGSIGCGVANSQRYSFDVTDSTFESLVLKADVPVLVMFYKPTCSHCQAMLQPVEDLARDMSDVLKVARLSLKENPETTLTYGVFGVPTFIIFSGGAIVSRTSGEMPEANLYEWVRDSLHASHD